MKDPIMNSLGVGLWRIAVFIFITCAIWGATWWLVMVEVYTVHWSELKDIALAAYDGRIIDGVKVHIVMFWVGATLSLSLAANIFLFIAWRWNKSAQIHHRGVVLEDHRGGRHVR